MKLLLILVLIIALGYLDSCTIEKRFFRKGYSISWNHRLKDRKEKVVSEWIDADNVIVSDLDSIQEPAEVHELNLEPISLDSTGNSEMNSSQEEENYSEAPVLLKTQHDKESTDIRESKFQKISVPDYHSANILAGICVGIVVCFLIYAVIVSGGIKFNPNNIVGMIFLIAGVSILVIALILFLIIRSMVRY